MAAPFRFSFNQPQEKADGPPPGHVLFRRWEAVGLLLLVTVGAGFVPAVQGSPAMGNVFAEPDGRGGMAGRVLSLAPLLLSLALALRSSRYLMRRFDSFASVLLATSLSSMAVYIAFLLGVFLLLRGSAPPGTPLVPFESTFPGALAGWILILVVAWVRLLSRRATRGLEAARDALAAGREREG